MTHPPRLSEGYGLLLLITLLAVALLVPEGSMLLAWFATMALLVALTALIGRGVTGHWGALIDERNRLSLSRVQVLVWTVLVLSGFLIAASVNVRARKPNPLAIDIPTELWLPMGIGTTTLVAAPPSKASSGT